MTFEQGPIRPPSEAESLFIRITRNCPWQRCIFCPVYKNQKFSARKVEEIFNDIDEIIKAISLIKEMSWKRGDAGEVKEELVSDLFINRPKFSSSFLNVAVWLYYGKGTIFLQDSDALVIPTDSIIKVLRRIREKIPDVTRITCYSRSATLKQKGPDDLREIKEAGLDRVHVGLESGSNKVLEFTRKGESFLTHIQGAMAAKEAGLEISEYIMPGLGGKNLSREHAIQTAKAISEISPHFVRLRTLGIRKGTELYELVKCGKFQPLNDDETAREIKLFIESMESTTTTLVSDHILNLLGDLEGPIPEKKEELLAKIENYLSLPEEDKNIFRIGRRLGYFNSTDDLKNTNKKMALIQLISSKIGQLSREKVDQICQDLVSEMV